MYTVLLNSTLFCRFFGRNILRMIIDDYLCVNQELEHFTPIPSNHLDIG